MRLVGAVKKIPNRLYLRFRNARLNSCGLGKVDCGCEFYCLWKRVLLMQHACPYWSKKNVCKKYYCGSQDLQRNTKPKAKMENSTPYWGKLIQEDATEHTLKSFMSGNKRNQQQDGATTEMLPLAPLDGDQSSSVVVNVESGTISTLDADEINRLHISSFEAANVNIQIKAKLTPLQSATMCDNVTLMSTLWHNNATDKDVRNRRGMTLLHLASVYGSESVCKFILAKSSRFDLREKDSRGWNAVHFAAWNGRTSIMKMLLENDASFVPESVGEGVHKLVNIANNEGKIPLHLAVVSGNDEIVKLLIDNDSNVNAEVPVLLETPLYAACFSNNFCIIELLLDGGADVGHRNFTNKTPLHRACRYCEDPNVVEAFIKYGAEVEARDRYGQTPLLVAARYGRKRLFEYLLKHGADVEAVDREGCNVLHVCASNNQIEILQIVLENSEKQTKSGLVVQWNRHGNAALHDSASMGFTEICELLLLHGAPMTLKSYWGSTSLHWAAQMGRLSTVKSMLNHCRERCLGDLVDDKDEDGDTPSHCAAIKGHYDVMRLLYEDAGAHLLIKNLEGKTPLDCVAALDHGALFHGLSFHGSAESLCRVFDLKIFKNLKDLKAVQECIAKSFRLACENGQLEVVKFLLEKDAETDYIKIPLLPQFLNLATSALRRDVAMAIINSASWTKALRSSSEPQSRWSGALSTWSGALNRWSRALSTWSGALNRWSRVLSRWSRALNRWSGHRHHQTPLRDLIEKLPDVALIAFHRCITIDPESVEEKKKKSLRFDFEFIDDTFEPWNNPNAQGNEEPYDSSGKLRPGATPYSSSPGVVKWNHPFMTMVRWKREELLSHPLVLTFLGYKWSRHQILYYFLLVFYCIYVSFLTAFVLSTPPPYKVNAEKYGYSGDKNISGLASANNYTSDDNDECSRRARAYDDKQHPKSFSIFCKYAVLVLVVFRVVFEIVEFAIRKWGYIIKYENLIKWTMYCSVLIMVVDFTKCASQSGIREDWQWQSGCVGLFLSWINLVLILRKFHTFGLYFVTFTAVTKTFLKVFIVLFLFIGAFAMALYGLLQNQNRFRDTGSSILKTTTMMIGEFSFDEIFNSQSGSGDDNKSDSHAVHYPILTQLLFFFFVCIMTIIVMNLLIGFAVGDINSVMEKATLNKLAMQAEFVLDVETMLFVLDAEKRIPLIPDPILNIIRIILCGYRNFMIRHGCFVKYLKYDVDEIDSLTDPILYKAMLIAESNNFDNSRQDELQQLMKDSTGRIYRIENIVLSLAQKQEITFKEPQH